MQRTGKSVRDRNDMRKKILVILFFAYCTAISAAGHGQLPADTVSVQVWFRQGYSALEPSYRDNGSRLRAFVGRVQALRQDSTRRFSRIRIVSGASPEGGSDVNKRLSAGRALRIRSYLEQYFPIRDSLFEVASCGVDWQGLAGMVEASDMPYRAEVLDILHNTPEWVVRNGVVVDSRKRRLAMLHGGRPWRYMEEHFFPELRSSGVQVICVATPVPCPEPVNPPEIIPLDEIPVLEPVVPELDEPVLTPVPLPVPARPEYDKRTFLAVKSNLLYDAATVLNFSVEVPFTERFSLLYEQHTPWWLSDNNRFCVEFLSFGGEFRWWFAPHTRPESERRVKRDALMGHFVGVYGAGGKFDFQLNRTFCYQGEFFSAGLTYGYAMPVGRRLNMEFSVSLGYARIPHRHYVPTDDWQHLIRDPHKSGTWNYFGPTRVGVSLVMPFFIRHKKGGDR